MVKTLSDFINHENGFSHICAKTPNVTNIIYWLTSKDDSSCSEIIYIQTKYTQYHCRSDQVLCAAVVLLKEDKYLVQKLPSEVLKFMK